MASEVALWLSAKRRIWPILLRQLPLQKCLQSFFSQPPISNNFKVSIRTMNFHPFSSINPLYPCVDVGKADDLLTDGWRRWCGPQGQVKCDTFWGEGSTASQVTLERQYVQKSVVCIGADRSGWFHHESLWSCRGKSFLKISPWSR